MSAPTGTMPPPEHRHYYRVHLSTEKWIDVTEWDDWHKLVASLSQDPRTWIWAESPAVLINPAHVVYIERRPT